MNRPVRHALPSIPALRLRRWRTWLAGVALIAGMAPAFAGVGAGLLNAVAALRGHGGPRDQAYGPLPRQRFDLYLPGDALAEADKTGGAPLVVFFYGGSWSMGERADYGFAGRALAARGFVVMVADYRLYPEVRYPAFLEDGALATAWALEHARELGADPRRVFLYGHSAGAYNAAMLALDPRWLRATGHSPAELAGWVGLAGPYDFLPIGDPGVRLVFDWPQTAPDTQPLHHVGDLARPVPAFLGAAARDKVVDPDQNTLALAQALRDHDVPLTLRVYEHVNHVLLVGALAWPLTGFDPVLHDTAAFIRDRPPVAPPAP